MQKIITTGTLVIILSLFSFVQAQVIPDPVSLSASPASPSPGESVTIRAATPTFDKNSGVFNWAVEGKSRPDLSGLGKDTITLRAGDVGSLLKVEVSVSSPSGSGETSLTLPVSDLALTWFAQTYVPPWYKGKALPSARSIVNIIAIPQVKLRGAFIRPENLIYHWSLDDEEDIFSGVGEQVFKIKISDLPGTSHAVRVVIEDAGKEFRRAGEFFIVPASPHLEIYRSSPLGGIEFRSAGGAVSSSLRGEIDFAAEPFYFPVQRKSALRFRWEVGGASVLGSVENQSLLSLNTQGSPAGLVSLRALIDSKDVFTSSLSRTITLFLQ